MKRFMLFSLIAACCLAPLTTMGAPVPKPAKEDLIKEDLAKLEGQWRIVSHQVNGVERSAEEVALLPVLTFKGRDYTWSIGEPGAITEIDPTQQPKVVIYKDKVTDEKKQNQYGIYMIEGDVFIDCIAYKENDRPTDFTSKPGSGRTLAVYKRVKKDSSEQVKPRTDNFGLR